jgi:hypothetical protein
MALRRIKALYHFTDLRNLLSIRERGGLFSWRKLVEMGVAVAAPGGNDWSRDADNYKGVDAYVHLCLRSNHPMEYRAREEGRIEQSVFLEIDPAVTEIEGVSFTEDVSNKRGVELFPIENAADLIDFEVLGPNMNYKDQGMLERLRQAEKCEILVPDFIPIRLIRNL